MLDAPARCGTKIKRTLDAALARVVGLVSRCEEAALLSDDEVDALVRRH
jgi:hypothetical protein